MCIALPNMTSPLPTLTSLIIVQVGINVQVGKFPKFNKRAGWNKAVQVGIFHFLLVKIKVLAWNFPKLINVQVGIRACRLEFFKKLIRCAAWLLERLEYTSYDIFEKKKFKNQKRLSEFPRNLRNDNYENFGS